jgi:hypothetical protein
MARRSAQISSKADDPGPQESEAIVPTQAVKWALGRPKKGATQSVNASSQAEVAPNCGAATTGAPVGVVTSDSVTMMVPTATTAPAAMIVPAAMMAPPVTTDPMVATDPMAMADPVAATAPEPPAITGKHHSEI